MKSEDNSYDNEKVIWGVREANIRIDNPNRGFILFYSSQFKNLTQKKGLKVLDVGCSAGAKTKELKRHFKQFIWHGCDVSKTAIKMARKDSQGVKFFVGDAADLPVNDQKYDVMMMHSVLDHTDNWQKAIQEVYRVLKKGGVFLVSSPLEADLTTIHGWLTRFKAFRKHRQERCGHNFALSKKGLLNELELAGFKIDKFFFDWFYIAQLVDLMYYPFLQFFKKGPEYTVERLAYKDESFWVKLIRTLRTIVIVVLNIESWLTSFIPLGWFAYIKAVKDE